MYNLADFAQTNKDNTTPWGIWYSKRSTPIVVGAPSRKEAIKKAKKLEKKGIGKRTSTRQLSGKSAEKARKGKWVRERESGLSPDIGSKEEKRKARMEMTRYRKGLARKSAKSLAKEN